MNRSASVVLTAWLSLTAWNAVFAATTGMRQPVPGNATQSTDLRPMLEAVRARTGVPGLVAAAVRNGKIVAVGAAGVREIGTDHEITVDDPFLIGSCTKPMTRLLVARLVDEGALRFDMPLDEALPGVAMQEGYRRATIGDVMRHTAGLPGYERITPRDTPIVFELSGAPREQRTKFAAHVLMEKPGTPGKFAYSNAGFSILGNITERRTDKAWEDLMMEKVFAPLKMTSVAFGRAPEKTGVPLGHRRTDEGFVVAKMGPPVSGVFAPAGGVRLPIRDFARFVAYQAAPATVPGIMRQETGAALIEKRAADAGGPEGEVIFGGEGTFNAAFAIWPSKEFGVAVCVNGGDADEACQAAIDAVRQACAPDVGAPGAGASRGKLGTRIQAEDDGSMTIVGVEPGMPADKAGLKAGDRLVEINGKALKDLEPPERMEAMRAARISLTVMRGKERVAIEIIQGDSDPGARK